MSEEKNFKDKIQLIPIEKLKLDDKNAKQHTNIQIDQLKKSIERFGFLSALVINKDFVVVAGNGRLQALRLLPNYKEVPCYQVDFISEAEQRFLSLMDNAIQMQTGFLAEELQFNMEIIEKDTLIFQELQRLDFSSLDRSNLEIVPMEQINQKEQADNDFIREEQEVAGGGDLSILKEKKIIFGDIILLNNHRLICGDSFSKETLSNLIDNSKIDAVYTDPPYGMGLDTDFSPITKHFNSKKKVKTNAVGKNYKKVEGDDKPFDPSFLLEYFKDVKEVFLWGANYFADKLPNLAMGKSSWVVWNKRVEDGKVDYSNVDFTLSEFELCWSKTKHRQRILNCLWFGYNGLQYEGKECIFNKGSVKRVHPNQKPVRLITKCFEYFLKEEHKNIVDLFGGSGSTLIACEETKRNCFMVEFDPQYVEVIIERYKRYTNLQDEEIIVIRNGEKIKYSDLQEIV